MQNILIKKIKNALKTENPLESIKDIVSQYEEIQRLVKWRDKIISSGEYFGSKIKEVEEVNEKIMKSGFYEETLEQQFNREIKEYFKKH
jgi:hypothetical protein